MYSYLTSFVVLFITLLIPWIVGTCALHVIIPKKSIGVFHYLAAPFLGLGLAILTLQNLVYLNVPIKTSGPIFLAIFVVLAAYQLFRRLWNPTGFVWIIAGVLMLLTLINSVGYFRESAKWYVGYGWQDQYNYTVLAQFLLEYPFHSELPPQNPDAPAYLVRANLLRSDRIGQSVEHAFMSSVLNKPANYSYGAVSLLAPGLMFLAMLYLLLMLGIRRWISVAFAFGAAVVPATSVIHLEDFFSQAMGTPMLLMALGYMFFESAKLTWQKVLILSVLVATLNAVYSEYTMLFLIAYVVFYAYNSWVTKSKVTIWYSLAIVPVAVLLNVQYFQSSLAIFGRTNMFRVLGHVYPFNHSWYGYQRLFFGDVIPQNNLFLFIFVVVLFILSVTGFAIFIYQKRTVQSIAFATIAIGCFVVNAVAKDYPYQGYKMILSFSPLLAIGLAQLVELLQFKLRTTKFQIFVVLGVAAFLLIPAVMTYKLSNLAYYGAGRSIKSIVNTNDVRVLYSQLEAMSGKNIYLNANHPYELARLSYFGRNNRLWFSQPVLGDLDTRVYAHYPNTNLNTLPKEVTIVDGILSIPKITKKGVYGYVDGSIEGTRGNEYSWVGHKLAFYLFSPLPQSVILKFNAVAGPGNPDPYRKVSIRAKGSSTPYYTLEFKESTQSARVELPLKKGNNSLEMVVDYPQKVTFIPPADNRIFLINVNGMTIE